MIYDGLSPMGVARMLRQLAEEIEAGGRLPQQVTVTEDWKFEGYARVVWTLTFGVGKSAEPQ